MKFIFYFVSALVVCIQVLSLLKSQNLASAQIIGAGGGGPTGFGFGFGQNFGFGYGGPGDRNGSLYLITQKRK